MAILPPWAEQNGRVPCITGFRLLDFVTLIDRGYGTYISLVYNGGHLRFNDRL